MTAVVQMRTLRDREINSPKNIDYMNVDRYYSVNI